MSVGNPNTRDANKFAQLQRGRTTQQHILQIFGQPQTRTQRADGTQQWFYMHTDVEMSASTFIPIAGLFIGETETDSHHITFDFDQRGILRDYSKSNSQTHMCGLNGSC
jgi:outer membrane protein assembly factor BamE (lipoprotein component of BamABCDE complex)